MPNTNRQQPVYVPTHNPDTWQAAALYAGGELGLAYDANDRAYQRVQVDSGATAANPVGVVAANQLAFWKDKDRYLVTNDDRQAIGGSIVNAFRNQVAGIFRRAVTAGYFCDILQRGDNIPVAAGAFAGGVGQRCIAQTTGTAQVTFEAVGAANTYQVVGVARGLSGLTSVQADVDIPNIP